MKSAFAFFAIFAVILSPFVYDAYGKERCEIEYATSFDGLWIYKNRVCYGTFIGMRNSSVNLDKRALFTRF